MAFPDDYKRVQIPGGSSGVVAVQLGLSRQLLIDTNTWTIHLMDGVTPGGHKVLMQSQFAAFFQAAPYGEVAYVENGTDGTGAGPANDLHRSWDAPTLKALFDKFVDTSTPASWFLKDSGARPNFRNVGTETIDANTAVTAGFYRLDPSLASNIPAAIPTDNSVQLMMSVMTQSSDNILQLMYIRDDTGRIWSRTRIDGVFGDWILATGVTSGDLAAYVAKAGGIMTGQFELAVGVAGFAPLRVPDGVAPAAPVDGDIWREDSAGGLLFRKAGVTRTIVDSGNRPKQSIAIIADQKGAVDGGGTSVATAWTTRELNTELYDPDGIVSIAANQFTVTVDALASWESPFLGSHHCKTRLYNVTDGVIVSYGTVMFSRPADGLSSDTSRGWGVVEAGKTYRIEYFAEVAKASNGLGVASSTITGANILTNVILRRIQ